MPNTSRTTVANTISQTTTAEKQNRTHPQKTNKCQRKSAIQQNRKIIVPLHRHLRVPLLDVVATDVLILYIKPPVDVLNGKHQCGVTQCPSCNEACAEGFVVVVHRWLFRARVLLHFRERPRDGVLERAIDILLSVHVIFDSGCIRAEGCFGLEGW